MRVTKRRGRGLPGTCVLEAACKNLCFVSLVERLASSSGWLQLTISEEKHVYQGTAVWKYLKLLCVYHTVQEMEEAKCHHTSTSGCKNIYIRLINRKQPL